MKSLVPDNKQKMKIVDAYMPYVMRIISPMGISVLAKADQMLNFQCSNINLVLRLGQYAN